MSGLAQTTMFEEQGKTAVVVFREKTSLGIIAMRDEPRADAPEAIRQLKAMGITPHHPDRGQPAHGGGDRGKAWAWSTRPT